MCSRSGSGRLVAVSFTGVKKNFASLSLVCDFYKGQETLRSLARRRMRFTALGDEPKLVAISC